MKVSTLRPGLLVSFKTSVSGNVRYRKKMLEYAHEVEGGKQVARWETRRTVINPAEYDEAKKLRNKAMGLVYSVCAASDFGLLCPDSKIAKLEEAFTSARAIATEFNRRAQVSRIDVNMITGRIEANDVKAVQAINSEVRELLTTMEEGLRNLDVKAVRTAANKARNVGMMLSDDASKRIKTAIDVARASARKIVKAGEQVAQEIDLKTIETLAQQRTAFLDLDEVEAVATPTVETRTLDLAPETKTKKARVRVPELEV